MNKKIAFASDYDNTLYRHGRILRGISKKDAAAITAFRERGGLFGLCSGRPYRGFFRDPVIKKLRIDFYIASTGAHILDTNGDVLFEKTIPHEIAEEIFQYGEEALRHSVQVDGGFYLYGDKWKGKNEPRIHSLAEVKGQKLYEFSFHLPTAEAAAELTLRINENFGDAACAFQNINDIDIVAAGCSKGTGALFIMEHYGLELIAGMGDSMNDEPLLLAADIGYTFPKSPGALKDSADRLAKSVADALRQTESIAFGAST